MLLKSLLICGACVAVSTIAPALTPEKGSGAERLVLYGIVPAFMIKMSLEQDRWEELHRSGRLASFQQAAVVHDPNCCGGIPPWHVINAGR